MTYSKELFQKIRIAVELNNKHFLESLEPDLDKIITVLAEKDSEMRDQVSWSTLSFWFRSSLLSNKSRALLCNILSSNNYLFFNLENGESDDSVLRSFSVLTLGDLVAGDFESKSLDVDFLFKLSKLAVKYLLEEKDLRGYVENLGWIHACAHTADLIRELGLHPNTPIEVKLILVKSIFNYIHSRGMSVFQWDEDFRLARALSVLLNSLSDSHLSEIFNQFRGKFLYETPARQNILTTLRACYLELIWENNSNCKNISALIEPLIRS